MRWCRRGLSSEGNYGPFNRRLPQRAVPVYLAIGNNCALTARLFELHSSLIDRGKGGSPKHKEDDMAETIEIKDNTVELTDKDGTSVTLKREKAIDAKTAKVKVNKKWTSKNGQSKGDKDSEPVVHFSLKDNVSKWEFDQGHYANIEIECPTKEQEKNNKKPTLHVSFGEPTVEAKVELKDHEEQDKKIKELTKMFGDKKKK
jgi:hypothetical protein